MFRTRPLTVAALAIALMPAVAVGGQTGTGGPEAHTVARAAAATQAESAPSHRLIVQLSLPALSEWARAHGAVGPGGRIDLDAPAATAHLERLRAERRAFVKALAAVPGAGVGRFVDENGRSTPLEFEIAYNGVAVDAGRSADLVRLERALRALPGVRGVHPDLPHGPSMYSSLGLIQASKLWSVPAIGGIAHAGEGVKVASVDGGIHHGGVMFDGTGYTYPPGYPLGYADNTNGKIIASRAYFRSWDPPAAGEGFPWPGPTGTSHGQHTASTAVGNPTEIDYHGNDVALSGVAPRAYAMSYRVFYGSVQGIGSFYTAEGIAALEDVVRDGADVVNNSWGGGATSQGGIGDPLDSALVGVWRAGVFVSMSEGNGGPNLHTGDHPSEDYVNVANSTTSGAFQESRDLSVTAPEPVPGDHQRIVFGLPADDFGPGVEVGRLYGPLPYKTSASVAPENEEGCSPFPAGAFDGSVALVMRGTCQFGVKALNAEQAGAGFVVIYNNQANGDTLSTMSAGDVGAQVTVPVVLIGRTPGLRLVAWHAAHAADARLSVGIFVRQVGNTPDIINAGSSRGPAVGDRLKPDIAAPGTNILAQGFADAPGEDTHLGFGQGTGTSMAAPHVAGAAALVRQLHPDWTPAEVKSALMSTARFRDIYVDAARTVPAQPLDMGAGRLDLEHAGDPGVLLSPPSLSFGRVPRGGRRSIVVRVRSVADAAEQYALSSVDVSGGFTSTAAVAGLTIEPATLSLEPGATGAFTVTWDSRRAAIDYGHNQGYVLLSGSAHQAHMPAWMQIAYPRPRADVLVLDNDGSALSAAARTECTGENPPPSYPDFGGVYTRTLEALGVDFELLDVDARIGVSQAIPDANELLQYRAVVHQTGNNPCPVLGSADQQRLIEYANHEGAYIGFGQDLSQVLGSADSMDPTNGTTFYNGYLGAEFLQDSVNANEVFTDTAQLLYGVPYSPLAGKVFDISARGDGAGNQEFVDEIRATRGRATVRGTPSDTTPLLQYVGTHAVEDGLVALTQRERPTLEYPAVAWLGRTTYFAFGLEGVSDDTGYGTRAQLLDSAVRWMLDEPTAVITAQVASAHEVTTFSVEMSSVVADLASLRWDFGDGTPFAGPVPVATAGTTAQPHAGHVYRAPGLYDVRVEATNVIGSRAIGRLRIEVPAVSAEHGYIDRYTFLYLPAAWRGGMP